MVHLAIKKDSGSDWDSLTGDDQESTSVFKPTKQRDEENIEYSADGFKSVELEDKSDIHNRIFEHNPNQHQDRQKVNNSDTLLPFTEFKAEKTKVNQKKHKHYTEVAAFSKESNSWSPANTQDRNRSYLRENKIVLQQDLDRLHENDTVHSLPTNTPANTNQHVTAPHFEINKNHAEFEYWDGPSSVAMMPIKSLRNETEDFQNVQRFIYEKCYYNAYTVQMENQYEMSKYATRIRPYLQRIWSEVFGGLQIVLEFFVIIILELLKVIFSTVCQKLIAGLIVVIGDRLLKPLYSSFFNFLLQPTFILMWNTTNGARKVMQPLVLLLGDILVPVSNVVRAFRIFDSTENKKTYSMQHNTKSV